MNLMSKEIPKASSYFKSFDGTKIYYETRGTGVPIVMIYGVCCQMNHWHHQMIQFSQTHQVITFDIRGHHQSEVPTDPSNLNIDSVARDVLALMEHLKLSKAHLVGHSFGVPVLIQLHSINSEKAISYSFVNGFAKNPIKGMFGLDVVEPFYRFVKAQYLQAPQLWSEFWRVATDNPLAVALTALAGGFNFKLTQFKDIEIYTRGVSQTPLNVFLPLFEDLMGFDGDAILRKIQVPTLVLGGEKDAVTPVKFQEQMHQLVKNSEYVLVPYGSHCTQLDFPDYVNLKLGSLFVRTEKGPK